MFTEKLDFFSEYFAIIALTWSNFVSLLGVFDCFAACADAFIASRFCSGSNLACSFFGLGLPDLPTWLVRYGFVLSSLCNIISLSSLKPRTFFRC